MTRGTGRRRGRRPGNVDTREVILEAAREAFAEGGYDGTTTRRIAAAAGVDPALIHHYFGTKEQLFAAAVSFPLDAPTLMAEVFAGDPDRLGERLVTTFVTAWDHPTTGPALEALLRGAVGHPLAARLVREFFTTQIARHAARRLVGVVDPAEVPVRAGLAAGQLFGLAMVRHLLKLEPLASLPPDTVAAAIAPTLQRYLTGPLGLGGEPTSRETDPDRRPG